VAFWLDLLFFDCFLINVVLIYPVQAVK